MARCSVESPFWGPAAWGRLHMVKAIKARGGNVMVRELQLVAGWLCLLFLGQFVVGVDLAR